MFVNVYACLRYVMDGIDEILIHMLLKMILRHDHRCRLVVYVKGEIVFKSTFEHIVQFAFFHFSYLSGCDLQFTLCVYNRYNLSC